MISFENDYSAGAHPRILQKLMETNLEPLPGYGKDIYCERAVEKIREACGAPEAQVYFLVGGTQTNAVVIASMLDSYQGVIAAESGHVSTHEAGAIELSGHKVLTLPEHRGKIDAGELRAYMVGFYADESYEHEVFPGMVYLSWPTEYGTLYSKEELRAIREVCREYGLSLYLDGARLGYGLMSRETDMTLADMAQLCDVFYIGGTKVGALCGEAVVFPHKNAPAHFMTRIKQRGALLAKGRLLGVQFDCLFTDGLYEEIGRSAIEKADRLKALFRDKKIPFYLESPTNQQFVIMENGRYQRLREQVALSSWTPYDEHHTVVRFVTSWSTTDQDLEILETLL